MRRFLLVMLILSTLACSKKPTQDVPSLPSTGDGSTPTNSPAMPSITTPSGQSIGQVVAQIPGATIIQTANGESFAVSSRAGVSTVFSASLIVQNNGQMVATSCVFASNDCSGPCLIDGNAGTPSSGALLLANQLHQLQGPVWKAEVYNGQAVTAAYVAIRSRLDLYGDGPYCSSSSSSVDHYYQLNDVTSSHSSLDNSQWQISN